MQVQLDGSTKIVMADRIHVRVEKGGEPLDLARDRILVVDPKTSRPVATITPFASGTDRPPAPCPVGTSAPVRAERNGDAEHAEDGGKQGRLTDAQREGLQRLVKASPRVAPDKIAEQFEKMFGRSIGVLTVKKYQEDLAAVPK